jgi:hypothetical protein
MIGDFNLHLQSVTKYLEPIGFKGALSNDIKTHLLGTKLTKFSVIKLSPLVNA